LCLAALSRQQKANVDTNNFSEFSMKNKESRKKN
jgi:hypothetical protein